MKITTHDMMLIERLRKRDRRWRWARWLVLVMGILSSISCAVFGYALHRLIAESAQGHPDSDAVFFIVLFWTKCCLYFSLSVWCFATVSMKWHGDVARMLLLKLLDAKTVK